MHANKQINVCRVFADFFGAKLKANLDIKVWTRNTRTLQQNLAMLLKTTLKYVKYLMIWFALSCTHAYMFRFYSYLLFLWNLWDCWIHNKCVGLHGNLSFLMADKKTRTWSNLLLLSRKNVIAYAHDGKFSNKENERLYCYVVSLEL